MRRTIAAACPQLTDRYRLIVRVFRRALLCFVYVAYSKEKEYNEKSHYRQTISYSKGLPLLFFDIYLSPIRSINSISGFAATPKRHAICKANTKPANSRSCYSLYIGPERIFHHFGYGLSS